MRYPPWGWASRNCGRYKVYRRLYVVWHCVMRRRRRSRRRYIRWRRAGWRCAYPFWRCKRGLTCRRYRRSRFRTCMVKLDVGDYCGGRNDYCPTYKCRAGECFAVGKCAPRCGVRYHICKNIVSECKAVGGNQKKCVNEPTPSSIPPTSPSAAISATPSPSTSISGPSSLSRSSNQ